MNQLKKIYLHAMAPNVERSDKNSTKSKVFFIHFFFQCILFSLQLSCTYFNILKKNVSFFHITNEIFFVITRLITAADNGCYRIDVAFKVDWISFGIN